MSRLILAVSLCLLFAPLANSQGPNRDSEEVFRQLLSLPAPTPNGVVTIGNPDAPKERPADFFDPAKAPPDDATFEDLLAYWSVQAQNRSDSKPSEHIQQRLLAGVTDTESVVPILPVLSPNAATETRIKELYDKARDDKQESSAPEKVREWLLFNSKYFLTELLTLANKVQDKDGYVDKKEALKALAKLDWSGAEPILQDRATGNQPRTAAFAISLLYEHAQKASDLDAEEKYRARLKTIASDRNAPARARDTAIDALSLTDWSGRDDWYMSLLSDDTLLECRDGHTMFNPLQTLFSREPEKWIPVMAKLVESKDRAVQQAAASCLVLYATHRPRRDAILPVLRWLSEPDWVKINGTQRAWFMQAMDELEMPESIPGLIWIVENEESNRIWAARTLAHYKDPRAIPALKKALATEPDENDRRYILEGLIASGGLSDSEQLAALEAYAAKLTTPEGREEVERIRHVDPLPLPISVGRFLASRTAVSDSLVKATLARAAILQKRNKVLAQALLEATQAWQSRQIDLDMVNRIGSGSAHANAIANALTRRAAMRETVGPELHALIGAEGAAAGIAAVLLDNSSLAQNILSSGSDLAQIGLLASARLTQMQLPVESVGTLLQNKNSLLAHAAEQYLLIEDSVTARELLWKHHPGTAFITGWRENIEAIAKYEDSLRAELFKENGPLGIFALISDYQSRDRVLRVYADKAVFTFYENPARYRERLITSAELATFKSLLATNHFADMGPQLFYCHHNCWVFELLLLTKDKGRRVFNNQAFDKWLTLIEGFDRLGRGDNARTHYNLEKEIKGLKVLYSDDSLAVRDVWQQGSDIRIFVERPNTDEEVELASQDSDDEDDEVEEKQRRRHRAANLKARFSWRSFANEKLGALKPQPEGYSDFDESRFSLDENDGKAQPISADSVVITRNFEGLWRQTAGQKAVRISGEDGAYANPVVTPDGKWVVVAKTDSDWSRPNYVVRFNLQSGQEFRVALAPALQFDPVAYLPTHRSVLLRRAKDEDQPSRKPEDGPETPEYYLLDVATGASRLIKGEFAPLRQEGKRFLQPTSMPDVFWTAIPDGVKNQTEVGRYNLKDFSFSPLLTVPHISFDSMSIWVDELGEKLYFVYEGQLLSIPFPSLTNKSAAR